MRRAKYRCPECNHLWQASQLVEPDWDHPANPEIVAASDPAKLPDSGEGLIACRKCGVICKQED